MVIACAVARIAKDTGVGGGGHTVAARTWWTEARTRFLMGRRWLFCVWEGGVGSE